MSRSAASSTILRISSAGTTQPVGLFGEQRTTSLVFGVMCAATISAVIWNRVSSVSTTTGVPPAKWMISGNETQ